MWSRQCFKVLGFVFLYLQGFRCICKLIAHYQTNKLPHVNCNLARECFPKDNIPSHSSYSDTSDVVNDQYASVNPQQNKVPPVNAVEITPLWKDYIKSREKCKLIYAIINCIYLCYEALLYFLLEVRLLKPWHFSESFDKINYVVIW